MPLTLCCSWDTCLLTASMQQLHFIVAAKTQGLSTEHENSAFTSLRHIYIHREREREREKEREREERESERARARGRARARDRKIER